MNTTQITWNATASNLPDDDECVLIALPDGEVWTVVLDAGQWFYVSGDPIGVDVTHWAAFPMPPEVRMMDEAGLSVRRGA